MDANDTNSELECPNDAENPEREEAFAEWLKNEMKSWNNNSETIIVNNGEEEISENNDDEEDICENDDEEAMDDNDGEEEMGEEEISPDIRNSNICIDSDDEERKLQCGGYATEQQQQLPCTATRHLLQEEQLLELNLLQNKENIPVKK